MGWPGAFALVGGIGCFCAFFGWIAYVALKYGNKDK